MDALKQYYDNLLEWKRQNNIPEDEEEPGNETPKRPDEEMMDVRGPSPRHRYR